ncbi:hypothetical protein C8R43DRAFT_1137506 [Mycena crocata]|nr:hypothetical protein C8R43DRAFT_1137506 [Mycena crocata]
MFDSTSSLYTADSIGIALLQFLFGFRGRSGISAQCGNIEYTMYRRPASGLECSKKGRRRPRYRHILTCNATCPCTIVPPLLEFTLRGAAAQGRHIENTIRKRQKRRWKRTPRSTFNAPDGDSLPALPLTRIQLKYIALVTTLSPSFFARLQIRATPQQLSSRPSSSRSCTPRFHLALARRFPAQRAIKFADLTQAVNQRDQDALDFLAGSTVLLRVHALPTLCAIRASHAPTLPPCKPTCALLCRQD